MTLAQEFEIAEKQFQQREINQDKALLNFYEKKRTNEISKSK